MPPPLPTELKKLLEQRGNGVLIGAGEIEALPLVTGAYLLVITIAQTFDLTITTLPASSISSGVYLYCGSARGPGGIRARLKRHFAKDKRKHWHVDHMTLQADNLNAIAVPEGDECDLADGLLHSGLFILPVNGFGASDCASCQSHLLKWNGS